MPMRAACLAAAVAAATCALSDAAAAAACYIGAAVAPPLEYACAAGRAPGECVGDAALYNTGAALVETTYSYSSSMNGVKMRCA